MMINIIFSLVSTAAALTFGVSRFPGLLLPSATPGEEHEVHFSSISGFLQEYLECLRRAGLVKLVDLPDFAEYDDARPLTFIDYAVSGVSENKKAQSLDTLYNISMNEVINAKFRDLWLDVSMGEGYDEETEANCLLEHDTSLPLNSARVRMRFQPLTFIALCKREVLMIIQMDEVTFSMNGYACHSSSLIHF